MGPIFNTKSSNQPFIAASTTWHMYWYTSRVKLSLIVSKQKLFHIVWFQIKGISVSRKTHSIWIKKKIELLQTLRSSVASHHRLDFKVDCWCFNATCKRNFWAISWRSDFMGRGSRSALRKPTTFEFISTSGVRTQCWLANDYSMYSSRTT